MKTVRLLGCFRLQNIKHMKTLGKFARVAGKKKYGGVVPTCVNTFFSTFFLLRHDILTDSPFKTN